MKGFKNIFCTLTFCTSFEEMRQLFCMKNQTRVERCRIIAPKISYFNDLVAVAA